MAQRRTVILHPASRQATTPTAEEQ